jgi:ArsR family transcriptional regulator, arsenate/arsenite/antimonite-responsive transcriptional repressor
MNLKQVEKIAKALGDINRLKILNNIANKSGTMHCAEIVNKLDLAQPSISHHIKTLIEAGLITAEKEGRNHIYQLNKPVFNLFVTIVSSFTKAKK